MFSWVACALGPVLYLPSQNKNPKMASSNEQNCRSLQDNLREFDPKLVALSTLARKGDDKVLYE